MLFKSRRLKYSFFALIFIVSFFTSILSEAVFAKETKFKPVHIKGVPLISQHPELPTGCETVALTMFVNYYGIKHNKMKMISLIPKGRAPYFKNGKMYAADPMVEFVGNPKSKHGFGIFYPPFVKMLEGWFGKRVQNISGSNFNKLLDLVSEGHPVLFWISIPNLRGLSKVTKGPTWTTDKTNRKFTWPNNEHAAVLVGYTKNREKILINDPYTGSLLTLPYSIVKDRYEALEKQAIYLKEEKTGSLYKGVFSLNTKKNKEIQLIHLDDRYYLGSKAISLLTKNTENPIQVSEKKDGFLFKKVDKKK